MDDNNTNTVGSIKDLVVNNEKGLTVPVKNVKAIVEAVLIINGNLYLFNKIIKKAIGSVTDNFSLDNYIFSVNKIYNDTLS